MYHSTIKNYSALQTVILLILFSVSINPILHSQITIEENAFTQYIGKKYKEVLYETNLSIDGQLAEIKAAIGPNQVWDFSDLNYVDSTVILYELMEVNPNDPDIHVELARSYACKDDLEKATQKLRRKKVQLILGGREASRYQVPRGKHVHSFPSLAELAGFAKAAATLL